MGSVVGVEVREIDRSQIPGFYSEEGGNYQRALYRRDVMQTSPLLVKSRWEGPTWWPGKP